MVPIVVTVEFQNEETALALAQFVKRLSWISMRECAVSEDETYLIRDGICLLQSALRDAGFSPR